MRRLFFLAVLVSGPALADNLTQPVQPLTGPLFINAGSSVVTIKANTGVIRPRQMSKGYIDGVCDAAKIAGDHSMHVTLQYDDGSIVFDCED